VLKPNGLVLIGTPSLLNAMSRVRFLFTGFLRGRMRPAHFISVPGQALNIYLLYFYEFFYLLFHYGFEIVERRKTQDKFPARFFTGILWPSCGLSVSSH